MARPLKKIDAEQVFKLARLSCTNEEIGDFLGVCEKTIRNRFSAQLRIARATVKMSIRRAQFLRAVRYKSDRMLIHLGKCELGQTYGNGPDRLEEVLRDILDA